MKQSEYNEIKFYKKIRKIKFHKKCTHKQLRKIAWSII